MKRLGSALLFLALLACGGSDGSPAQPPEPPAAPAPLPAKITYVALGDSTGFGIGALPGDGGYPPRLARRLRDRGADVTLRNLSIPGATARDVADVELPLAEQVGTIELLTVCIGANDVGTSRTVEQFGVDMVRVFAGARRVARAVVACNVPDLSLTPHNAGLPPSYRERIVAMNAELARAAATTGVPVVDLFSATRERLVGSPDLVSADGYHPSAAGYEAWADVMLPAVLAALAPAPAPTAAALPRTRVESRAP